MQGAQKKTHGIFGHPAFFMGFCRFGFLFPSVRVRDSQKLWFFGHPRYFLVFFGFFWFFLGTLHGKPFFEKNMHETKFFEESPAREALLQRKTRTKPNVSKKTLGSKRFITLFSLKWAQASPIKPKISIKCMAPRPQAFRQY